MCGKARQHRPPIGLAGLLWVFLGAKVARGGRYLGSSHGAGGRVLWVGWGPVAADGDVAEADKIELG